MPKALSNDQIARYHHDGYLYPLPGIGKTAAQSARAALEGYEADQGGTLGSLGPNSRYKLHVKLPWLHAVATAPEVLDKIEALIGQDILIFTSTVFTKEPHTDAVALWHQDAAYFGLRPHLHVTAWVAFSDASEAAGCMSFVTEAGRGRLLRHQINADPNSINGAGQSIVETFDRECAVRGALRSGELSIHHTLCVHSSPANLSSDRRIGFGISYIPTQVQHIGTIKQRAMLVRGQDRFGHFEHEPPPGADSRENASQHALSLERYNRGYAEQMQWHEEGRLPA